MFDSGWVAKAPKKELNQEVIMRRLEGYNDLKRAVKAGVFLIGGLASLCSERQSTD